MTLDPGGADIDASGVFFCAPRSHQYNCGMSDEPKSLAFPRLRKLYLLGNGLALAILLVAQFINLIVGPRNPGIVALILFQLFFAWLVLVLLDSVNRRPVSTRSPFLPGWAVPRSGEQEWKRNMELSRRQTSVAFLCFTPAFFLFVAVVLLYAAITGTINPLPDAGL
jgi:hypothetical protein